MPLNGFQNEQYFCPGAVDAVLMLMFALQLQ